MEDLIYNQRKIPKNKWRYGFRSSAATGCGWIAVYNALFLMGHRESPEKLVRNFTWRLPLVNGNFGTSIFSPVFYFKQHGFQTKIRFGRRKFDETLKESDAGVLFYFWRNKFRFGAHFVAVEYKDGKVIGYNTYRNSSGPDVLGGSLSGFLKKRKYFCSMLIGVRNK